MAVQHLGFHTGIDGTKFAMMGMNVEVLLLDTLLMTVSLSLMHNLGHRRTSVCCYPNGSIHEKNKYLSFHF